MSQPEALSDEQRALISAILARMQAGLQRFEQAPTDEPAHVFQAQALGMSVSDTVLVRHEQASDEVAGQESSHCETSVLSSEKQDELSDTENGRLSSDYTLASLIDALQQGRTSALELATQALNAAEVSSALNAFVAIDRTWVLEQAQASDVRRQAGKALSEIDGIPIAIKDNYLTKDYPTTACSQALPDAPDSIDATVVARLRSAGAVVFAKTNMHEWAYGATNSGSSIGRCNNPHNHACITGGSSGGSAAAVAAGIVTMALGSDTGGSVRIPSAACGIYGFKPSYGRTSRHGVLPLSWSLDAPGPMARSLDDILNVLPYFYGADKNDASTVHAQPFGSLPSVNQPKLLNLSGAGLERSDEVERQLASALQRLNIPIANASIDNLVMYFAAWEIIMHCEASSYHSESLQTQATRYSPITRVHLEAGKHITALDYLKAQKIRSHLQHLLLEGMGDWDALVLPTLPVVAPKHDVQWQEFGGRRVTTQDSMTWFCWLGNLAGLPCLSLPIGMSEDKLPMAMMLMGKPGDDEKLLAIGQWVDQRL